MFEHYLAVASPWLTHYGYFALFLAIFIEGFGVPAPGQSLVIAATMLSVRGEFSLPVVILVSWVSAVLGNQVGYVVGRKGGKALFSKVGVLPHHVDKVEHFFLRYGGGIIIVARFVEGLRQLNGIVAGSMQLPWQKFLFYNAIGATLWVGLWAGGIFYLGKHMTAIETWLQFAEPWLLVVGLTALGGICFYLISPVKKH